MDKQKLQSLLSSMITLTATAGIEVRSSSVLWERFEDIARAVSEAQILVDSLPDKEQG